MLECHFVTRDGKHDVENKAKVWAGNSNPDIHIINKLRRFRCAPRWSCCGTQQCFT